MQPVRIILAMLFAACAAASTTACASNPLWVELGSRHYQVEVADTDSARARGLMFRESLAADRGMLFIHDREERLAYWMKNTRIPLDILYFDSHRRLVSQQRDVPPCPDGDWCPAYPSAGPALYVLELNAGQAAEMGLEDGARLEFGPGIADGD